MWSCPSATAVTWTTCPRRCATQMTFHVAMTIDEVLSVALEPAPQPAAA